MNTRKFVVLSLVVSFLALTGCGDATEPEMHNVIVRAACIPGGGARIDPCNSVSEDGYQVFQCAGFEVNGGCTTPFFEGRIVCTEKCGISP